MKKIIFGLSLFTAVALGIAACNKDNTVAFNSSEKTPLVVYLTDAPLAFDTVNLDIKYVEVKLDTNAAHKDDDNFGDDDEDSANDDKHHDGFGVWDTLTFTPSIINVAAFRNGIDKMIATGTVTGTVRKIRLTLGTNNSLVQNGVTYPLTVRSRYVYVDIKKKHHQKDSISSAATAIKIDVDLFRSIKLVNGSYYFLPFIKPFNDVNFAAVSGNVTPAESRPFITVFNATDTNYGVADKSGYYKIRGLQSGNYSINFKGNNGYKDTTISNIVLTVGSVTKAPTVTLRK
jgi:hypothetical protein